MVNGSIDNNRSTFNVTKYLFSRILFGSADIPLNLLFRSIPYSVIILGMFWAITQGIIELHFYFAYLMPRIEKRINNGWLAWALTSFFSGTPTYCTSVDF